MKAKTLLTVIVGAIVGFLLGGNAPLGALLWPPADMGVTPTDAQLVGFVGVAILEAVAFGLGLAFLAFAYPQVRRLSPSRGAAVAMFASIVWLLVTWVPHDSLHMHVGMNLGALLALEWGFHVTLIAAGACLAYFVPRALATPRAQAFSRGSPAGVRA